MCVCVLKNQVCVELKAKPEGVCLPYHGDFYLVMYTIGTKRERERVEEEGGMPEWEGGC